MFPVFDPRDAACKSPFGAVACGAEVSFTLRDGDYYACELLVHREFAGVTRYAPSPLPRAASPAYTPLRKSRICAGTPFGSPARTAAPCATAAAAGAGRTRWRGGS